MSFMVDDPGLEGEPFGMTTLNMGDDPDGPVAVLFSMPPNLEFAAHYHETDQCFVVLEGSWRIGRTWYGPGSVRVQDAGSVYGPGVVGPDGLKAISFYGDRTKLPDQYASDRDRRRGEELADKWGYADLASRRAASETAATAAKEAVHTP
jgi:hypothetical protein